MKKHKFFQIQYDRAPQSSFVILTHTDRRQTGLFVNLLGKKCNYEIINTKLNAKNGNSLVSGDKILYRKPLSN